MNTFLKNNFEWLMEIIKNGNSLNLNHNTENKISQLNVLLISFSFGLKGALIVFFLTAFTKLLSSLSQASKVFSINSNDLVFSFWGFAVISFIVSASLFKNQNKS